jgi:hypothetical protein
MMSLKASILGAIGDLFFISLNRYFQSPAGLEIALAIQSDGAEAWWFLSAVN